MNAGGEFDAKLILGICGMIWSAISISHSLRSLFHLALGHKQCDFANCRQSNNSCIPDIFAITRCSTCANNAMRNFAF